MTLVSEVVQVKSGKVSTASVSCPAGYMPTGGGFAFGDHKVNVSQSTPVLDANGGGWSIVVRGTEAGTSSGTVSVICVPGSMSAGGVDNGDDGGSEEDD